MILLPLLFALALADPLIEQTSFTGTPEQSGWHITAHRSDVYKRQTGTRVRQQNA